MVIKWFETKRITPPQNNDMEITAIQYSKSSILDLELNRERRKKNFWACKQIWISKSPDLEFGVLAYKSKAI